MRRGIVAILAGLSLAVAACAPAAPTPAAQQAAPTSKPAAAPAKAEEKPAAQPGAYEQLVEKARAEGVVEFTYPDTEETVKILERDFRQATGVSLTLKLVPMSSTQVNPPMLTALKAGKTTFDQVEASDLFALEEEGALEYFDWVGVFGQKFPKIKEAVDLTYIPEFKGKVFPSAAIVYGFLYNKALIKPEDLPKTLEDAALPQYKGKVGLTTTGAPYTNLVAGGAVTLEQAKDLVRKLVANDVVLGSGSDDLRKKIELGAIPMGLISVSEAAIHRKEADYKLGVRLVKPVAYSMNWLVQPKNAAHPNASRLFTAWFMTEGWKTYMDREGNVDFLRPGSFWLEMLQEVGLTQKDAVLGGKTAQELKIRAEAQTELKKLFP